MPFHANLSARIRRALPLVLVPLCAFLVPSMASAQNGVCRVDPQVWMSNGTKIAISATIDDDPSNINAVVYALHVPLNADSVRVVYTGGALTGKESVWVVPDAAPGVYTASTTVLDDSAPTVTLRYQIVMPGVDPAATSLTSGTAITPLLSSVLQ
jgi:hypothetical protein